MLLVFSSTRSLQGTKHIPLLFVAFCRREISQSVSPREEEMHVLQHFHFVRTLREKEKLHGNENIACKRERVGGGRNSEARVVSYKEM